MNQFQQTIAGPIEISGRGLHTGSEVRIELQPAEPGHGIVFQRVDLPEQPSVKARLENVYDVNRGTSIRNGDCVVHTIEHLMAAVTAMQVDNLLVRIDGDEVPILDGSAAEFMQQLGTIGTTEQEEQRDIFELDKNIHFKDPETGIEFLAMPSDSFKMTVMIDYQSNVLGTQHASLESLDEFAEEFAPARTFCFLHELEMLLADDLIKGGDLDNAIVLVDKVMEEKQQERLSKVFNKPGLRVRKEGILNNVSLRYPNEPARHKLLDLLGDFSLIGTPVKANIIATKPGHKANIDFARKVREYIKEQKKKPDVPNYDPDQPPIYDSVAISNLLPHRYPFLLIDKIIEISEKEVVAIKNVTMNEAHFLGHFPGLPIMPGVLQIEALAQTGGILVLREKENPQDYNTFFLKIDKVKFKQPVVPGDTLILKMELTSPIRRGIVEMKATAFVGSKIVTEGELVARVMLKEPA